MNVPIEVHRHNILRRYMRPGKPRKDWHVKAFKNPPENYLALSEAAVKKCSMSIPQIILLGVLAGIYVGFAGTISVIASAGLDPTFSSNFPSIHKLLFGLTFPTGLAYILIAGGELFTGSLMYATIGMLSGKVPILKMSLLCFCVFHANYLGTVLVAGFTARLSEFMTEDPYKAYLVDLGNIKVINADFGVLVLRAIPANMLVCLAIIMASAAEDISGKILAIYIPIFSFAAVGMEHCIADEYLIHAAMFVGVNIPYGVWLWKTLLAVTLGNLIGAVFIGACYWYIYMASAQLGENHWIITFNCCRKSKPSHNTSDSTIGAQNQIKSSTDIHDVI